LKQHHFRGLKRPYGINFCRRLGFCGYAISADRKGLFD